MTLQFYFIFWVGDIGVCRWHARIEEFWYWYSWKYECTPYCPEGWLKTGILKNECETEECKTFYPGFDVIDYNCFWGNKEWCCKAITSASMIFFQLFKFFIITIYIIRWDYYDIISYIYSLSLLLWPGSSKWMSFRCFRLTRMHCLHGWRWTLCSCAISFRFPHQKSEWLEL